jgi:polyisoprenoid-binding protein YceI
MKTGTIIVLITAVVLSVAARAQVKSVTGIKGESSATYMLTHPMHEIEATSKDVLYTASIDVGSKAIQSVTAAVDVTSFDSGNSNRDSHAMEVIDALSYPEVMFTSTSVVPQGNTLVVQGKLTFHGVTSEITATATPEWTPEKLVVHAAFPLSLTAFKVERPALLFIPVQDTLRFTLTAAFALK